MEVGLCNHGFGSITSCLMDHEFNVGVFANVLRGLAEHCVIHELERFFSKSFFAFFLMSLLNRCRA